MSEILKIYRKFKCLRLRIIKHYNDYIVCIIALCATTAATITLHSVFLSTASNTFPLIIGMWPVKGITAGGSRIAFYGQHLNAFPPLGAYFMPSNDTGLASLYGYAISRSEGLNFKVEILSCVVYTDSTMAQ